MRRKTSPETRYRQPACCNKGAVISRHETLDNALDEIDNDTQEIPRAGPGFTPRFFRFYSYHRYTFLYKNSKTLQEYVYTVAFSCWLVLQQWGYIAIYTSPRDRWPQIPYNG